MKKFKRTLRLIGLILLIALGSMGVGLIGGVPIQPIRKKEDTIEVIIEMESSSKEDQDSTDESLFQQ
ncbi:MAG: hypothetical protein ACFB15_09725 [Cyclobacteriaceae bacterium]